MSARPSAARLARCGTCALGTLTLGTLVLGPFALGGCARHTPGPLTRSAASASRLAVQVDNRSTDRIDVYLIQGPSEWHLGRLEPGATASLALPALPPVGGTAMVRLAVIAGAVRSPQASLDARVTSMEQPVAELLRQRWTFTQRQLRGL
jgi:hypothetical protein